MNDPIRAADRPSPLPSEVLAGQGVAAFVLRPADLDRLPTLSSYPPEAVAEEPVTAAVVAPDEDDPDRFAEELLVDLRRLGNEFGPLGVAIAAATFTDPRVLVAQISDTDPRDPRPEPQLDLGEAGGTEPLDGQIARLAGYIVENVPGEPSRSEGAVDCAIRVLGHLLATSTVLRQEVEEQTGRAERAETLLASRTRQLDRCRVLADKRSHEPIEVHVGGAAHVTCDGRELLVEHEAAQATTTQTGEPLGEVVELYRDGDCCPNPACAKLAHRGPCSEDMPDLADEARRPRHDWYPDDGVTLSYRELRQLLALHLARCSGDPDLARAMREGESPLHLVEVLDR